MRAHEPDRISAGHDSRRTPNPGHRTHALLALQARVGNAAVVQLLREAGHPGAQVQRSAVPEVLSGGGQPLDGATRQELESRLGADFSDVRVHTGSAAKASAAEIGARAYTSGSHVVLGDGGADKHTLAHELTHVIQQRNGPVSGSDTGHGFAVSDPGDRFERAAEANAHRVMSGPVPAAQRLPEAGPNAPAGPSTVQRASHTTPENAVVTHYEPNKNKVAKHNLPIQRPHIVTGPITPVGTAGRPGAPNPLAVHTLWQSYKTALGRRGGPTENEVWKDLFGGAGYDRGHVMGLEVGGTDVRDNIVPQWSLNQGTGDWRKIEQDLVDLGSGTVRFVVSYAETTGPYRRVMVPIKIEVFVNTVAHRTWENAPDINDLIRSGKDPRDLVEYYTQTQAQQGNPATLDEDGMQEFALKALAREKGTALSHHDYELDPQNRGPGASTADTHMESMTRSTIAKDRRDKLIKTYLDTGLVTKAGSGAATVYTLRDAPDPVSDSDTSSSSEIESDSGSEAAMSQDSQPSPGQPFATMQFSQDSSDSDYEMTVESQ